MFWSKSVVMKKSCATDRRPVSRRRSGRETFTWCSGRSFAAGVCWVSAGVEEVIELVLSLFSVPSLLKYYRMPGSIQELDEIHSRTHHHRSEWRHRNHRILRSTELLQLACDRSDEKVQCINYARDCMATEYTAGVTQDKSL